MKKTLIGRKRDRHREKERERETGIVGGRKSRTGANGTICDNN